MFLWAALPLNVVRSLGVLGRLADASMTPAGSNDQVSAMSLSAGSTVGAGSLSTLSSRVLTLDNIVRITSAVTGTSTSGVLVFIIQLAGLLTSAPVLNCSFDALPLLIGRQEQGWKNHDLK